MACCKGKVFKRHVGDKGTYAKCEQWGPVHTAADGFSLFAYAKSIIFPVLHFKIVTLYEFPTLSLRRPVFPITFLNKLFPTWASTALSGSSSMKIAASLYTARARLILCFWPPLILVPFRKKTGMCMILFTVLSAVIVRPCYSVI